MKTVNIQHKEYGMVEGAEPIGNSAGWTYNGAFYFISSGWSQVPEKEWVTIQVEREGWEELKVYNYLYGPTGSGPRNKAEWRYPQ